MAVSTKITLRDLSRIAIFAAIIAVLTLPGEIPLAIGVPISFQTLGVMLAGVILGAYRGTIAAALYVILGLIGLPILSGHASGFAVLAGPTAGFLVGFIPGALVVGLIAHSAKAKFGVVRVILGSIVGGIGVVYAFGIPVLATSYKVDLFTAAGYMAPYLIGDAIKVALTTIIGAALYRAYPKAFKN